ncbi:hypothetical protein ACSOQS_000806 [Yersinia enterocolitica]|uniref:hypothetical protein n=1 Tax=Yersinia TaxID=629 RepID=UPI0011A0C444|nr:MULTISPECIES: hypothetical protein [Yersinia]EKN6107793.1 hypothetical protein [Yersinia enterocolitica]
MSSGIVIWLLTGYCSTVVILTGFALKHSVFYSKELSPLIFKTLLVLSFITFTLYKFSESFVSVLKNELTDMPKALSIVETAWKSYDNYLLYFALFLTVSFIVWFLLEFLMGLWRGYSQKKDES